MHKYTDEEKEFFKKYVPGHSHKEIQEEFIKKFGWEISIIQLRSSIKRYKLNTGRSGYFQKGNSPVNKGKKMSKESYEKCKNTMFKKGNLPHNHKPVGSERLTKDGYIEIKTREPNIWELKHRTIWESAHGKIPDSHIVIFKDGNKENLSIDNLMLIKRSTNLIVNRLGLGQCNNEFKEAAINLANLKSETQKAKKRGKKDE